MLKSNKNSDKGWTNLCTRVIANFNFKFDMYLGQAYRVAPGADCSPTSAGWPLSEIIKDIHAPVISG